MVTEAHTETPRRASRKGAAPQSDLTVADLKDQFVRTAAVVNSPRATTLPTYFDRAEREATALNNLDGFDPGIALRGEDLRAMGCPSADPARDYNGKALVAILLNSDATLHREVRKASRKW